MNIQAQYENQQALETRRKLGIPVIEEDAWKYARVDKAMQDLVRRKEHILSQSFFQK